MRRHRGRAGHGLPRWDGEGRGAREGAGYPHCDWLLDDINGDGAVDFNDIDRFVAVLSDGE